MIEIELQNALEILYWCKLSWLWVSSLHYVFVCSSALSFGEGNGNPLQYSCLENPMDRGAWWAAIHGVAKSRTRLSYFTFTFHFHALEKAMATHSSVLAWKIPGAAEPGGLLSMGSHRVWHDWSDLTVAAAAAYHSPNRNIIKGICSNRVLIWDSELHIPKCPDFNGKLLVLWTTRKI